MAAAPSVRWLWLALGTLAADRTTKLAFERLTTDGYRRVLIPGFAAFVHSRNTGMAFGIFGTSEVHWIPYALLVVSGIVVALLAGLLYNGIVETAMSGAGLALLAGGAAGNLLDRILHGSVTDFLELHAGSFYWPAFNLADSAITIGAVLLMIELFRRDSRRTAPHV
jgi:signal peptidase II